MDARTKGILTGAIGVLGALGYLALTVYPFGYGMAESAALAGAFVIRRTVPDSPRRRALGYSISCR